MEKKNLWNFEFIKTESFFFHGFDSYGENEKRKEMWGGGMDIPLDILPF